MRKLLLIFCLASLALAGCGGGDDGADKTDSAADAGADGGGTKTGTDAETDFSGKGSGDFCDLARQYEKDFDDTGNADSADDVEKNYKDLAKAVDNLVKEAPSEIKGDTQKVNDAFKDLNAVLAKYDYDFEKIPQAEADKMQLDSPEVEAASNRVESYFEKVCKIDSDHDGDTDGVIEDNSTSTSEQAPDDTTETTEEG
jgi:hypothetical protein